MGWQPVCQPFAGICTRVDHVSPSTGGPMGYCLTLDGSGTWMLSHGLGADCAKVGESKGDCEVILQSGKVSTPVDATAWHSLKLAMDGDVVTASVNGSVVTTYTDHLSSRSNQTGLVALISAAIPGMSFDDINVANADIDATSVAL